MKTPLILACTVLLMAIGLKSQAAKSDSLPKPSLNLAGNYILISLGAAQHQQLDAFHSPNPYQGYLGTASLGWHSLKGHWMSNLDLSGLAGFSNPYRYGDSRNQALDLGLRLHYSLRRSLFNKVSGHQLYAGLASQNYFNYRELQNFRNSSQSFTGQFGLGPSLAYTFSTHSNLWGLDLHWSWQSEFNMAWYSLQLRPGYVRQLYGEDPGTVESQFFRDLPVDFRHSFIWHRGNGNQLRLCYSWEYLQVSEPNSYHFGSHSLSLQLFYQL